MRTTSLREVADFRRNVMLKWIAKSKLERSRVEIEFEVKSTKYHDDLLPEATPYSLASCLASNNHCRMLIDGYAYC